MMNALPLRARSFGLTAFRMTSVRGVSLKGACLTGASLKGVPGYDEAASFGIARAKLQFHRIWVSVRRFPNPACVS